MLVTIASSGKVLPSTDNFITELYAMLVGNDYDKIRSRANTNRDLVMSIANVAGLTTFCPKCGLMLLNDIDKAHTCNGNNRMLLKSTSQVRLPDAVYTVGCKFWDHRKDDENNYVQKYKDELKQVL